MYIPSSFLFAAGFDYVAVIDHMLNFNATSPSNEVTVNISSDALLEIDEQFLGRLTLISTDANVTVSPAEAAVTIKDDDGMCRNGMFCTTHNNDFLGLKRIVWLVLFMQCIAPDSTNEGLEGSIILIATCGMCTASSFCFLQQLSK